MKSIMQFVTIDNIVGLLSMQVAIVIVMAPALLAMMGRGVAKYLAFFFSSTALVGLCIPGVGPVAAIACIHSWLIAVICALVAARSRTKDADSDAADA